MKTQSMSEQLMDGWMDEALTNRPITIHGCLQCGTVERRDEKRKKKREKRKKRKKKYNKTVGRQQTLRNFNSENQYSSDLKTVAARCVFTELASS